MPVEIERKFLVVGDAWRRGGQPGQRFCQGYLAADASGRATVRVRRAGSEAFLTVKGPGDGDGSLARPEFEYPIPVEDAEQMLAGLCRRPLIEKTRHEVAHAGRLWHVDEFGGDKAGLVLAEIELADPAEEVALPPWAGEEVTADSRYRNSALVDRPMGNGGTEAAGRRDAVGHRPVKVGQHRRDVLEHSADLARMPRRPRGRRGPAGPGRSGP